VWGAEEFRGDPTVGPRTKVWNREEVVQRWCAGEESGPGLADWEDQRREVFASLPVRCRGVQHDRGSTGSFELASYTRKGVKEDPNILSTTLVRETPGKKEQGSIGSKENGHLKV